MVHVVTFFGILAMVFGCAMLWNPQKWSEGLVRFSQHPAFHSFEILTRLICGAAFVVAADETLYPIFVAALGWLLVSVGVGLLFTPPARHRQFAVWSAQRFRHWFRGSGVAALIFGGFLIHAAVRV